MKRRRDMLWTWLLPEGPSRVDEARWFRHGGKWIVFDRKHRILKLARRLEDLIDSGRIPSAKYWNKDHGAICVYCLDEDRAEVRALLEERGAGGAMVWEYDYAWDRNVRDPVSFLYSQFSKFRTILQSYGLAGTLKLVRQVLAERRQ